MFLFPFQNNFLKKFRKPTDLEAVKGIRVAETITHPSMLALQDMIETDPEVNMLFTTMFTQDLTRRKRIQSQDTWICCRRCKKSLPVLSSTVARLVVHPSITS